MFTEMTDTEIMIDLKCRVNEIRTDNFMKLGMALSIKNGELVDGNVIKDFIKTGMKDCRIDCLFNPTYDIEINKQYKPLNKWLVNTKCFLYRLFHKSIDR